MTEAKDPRDESKDPRDEAERLIASVLGSASVAADGLSGWATGSDECCVCPVCRAIAAARQPNPNVAERLASGAGDLAQGLASVLRAFSGGFPGSSSQSAPSGSSAPAGSTSTATDEDPWHVATRAAAEAETGRAPGAAEPAAPPKPPKAPKPPKPPKAPKAPKPMAKKPMAKKATKPKAAPEPQPDAQPEAQPGAQPGEEG
jgi:hypothetical protein